MTLGVEEILTVFPSSITVDSSVFELPHGKHKYDSILSIVACINLSLFRANFTNIFETVHFSKKLSLWACRSLVNLQVLVGLALLGFLFIPTFFF